MIPDDLELTVVNEEGSRIMICTTSSWSCSL